MIPPRRSPGLASLPALLLALLTLPAAADEAIDRAGRRFAGSLRQLGDPWVFVPLGKGVPLPAERLALVRFDPRAAPIPRTLLTHRLLLPAGQHVTGTLKQLNAKEVHFTTSWGQSVTLPRETVRGIEQPDGWLLVEHDDFETSLDGWTIEGKPARDGTHAFAGKTSLRLDETGQGVQKRFRRPIRTGRLSVCVYDPGDARGRCWEVRPIWKGPAAALILGPDGYAGEAPARRGRLPASRGWHWVQIELGPERWRLYIDDYLLGEGRRAEGQTFAGVELRCRPGADGKPGTGALWFDEVLLASRAEPRSRPPTEPGRDTLWLRGGEQVFGRVVAADAHTVKLDAKFGRRSFSWAQVRGCYFVAKETPAPAPLVCFAPGPGCSSDALRGRLVRLDEAGLVVATELFGEVRVPRAAWRSIRWPDTNVPAPARK